MIGNILAPLLTSLENKLERVSEQLSYKGKLWENVLLPTATEERKLENGVEERTQSPSYRTQPPRDGAPLSVGK